MLENLSFRIDQLRLLLAAMDEIPDFRPPLFGPEAGALLLKETLHLRDSQFVPAQALLNNAVKEFVEKRAIAREAANGVQANMRNRYRKDAGALQTIETLSEAEEETTPSLLARMQRISAVWAKLPVPSGSPIGAMAYLPWKGMNRAVFDALCMELQTASTVCEELNKMLQNASAKLQAQSVRLQELLIGACEHGRKAYAAGSWQLVLIDSIQAAPLRLEIGTVGFGGSANVTKNLLVRH